MIKPTVGRVLWYYPAPTDNLVGNDGSQPLAAIIAHVWSDTCVNLSVFDANGDAHSRTSVLLVHDDHPAPASNYAEWMPYQKGQAAKTEQLEAQVATAVPATEQSIEQEIQANGLTSPRVTPADLTANIVHTEFVTHVSQSGQVLRWAVLTTKSGYAVVGRPSVSVSKENDNEKIGRQVAYDNSRNELWPLMGYALKEKIFGGAQ